jgi:hypothetical protein
MIVEAIPALSPFQNLQCVLFGGDAPRRCFGFQGGYILVRKR